MPLTLRNNIPYDDFQGGSLSGYTEQFVRDANQIVRPVIIAWSDKDIFYQSVLDVVANDAKNFHRDLPEQHPRYTEMWCEECYLRAGIGVPGYDNTQLVNFTAPGGAAGDGNAIVDMVYRGRDYNTIPDGDAWGNPQGELCRYVSRTTSYASEAIRIPGTSFKLDNSGGGTATVIYEPISRFGFTKHVQWTWHLIPASGNPFQLPGNLETNIEASINTMNSAKFDGRYPANTLLMISYDKVLYRSAAGQMVWDIQFNSIYRPAGWNKIYLKTGPLGTESPGYFGVLDSQTGTQTVYSATDHDKCFSLL